MYQNLMQVDVLSECKHRAVGQVLCCYTDVLGQLKLQQIPVGHLRRAFERGVLIDGSSVAGFARIQESDLRARLDPRTFHVLPWEIGGMVTAVMFCDVIEPNGRPFAGDPRHILRCVLARHEPSIGTFVFGPEAEYFYFRSPNGTDALDHGGYHDLVPAEAGIGLRTKTIAALTALGIDVEVGHHEVAPSQHEIDLHFKPAMEMADILMLYRWIVKEIAAQAGVYATFMPKPVRGENGSGMHVHVSAFRGETNVFFSAKNGRHSHLSGLARSFLAGLLENVGGITLVLNQWVNSYKRLVPGYEAPVYLAWGSSNRSALVRVPGYEPGHAEATRLELRSPDPACNPYLAFACIIEAGVDGIRRRRLPPQPVEQDIYHLSAAERKKLKIASLPGDLDEALTLFRASDVARTALGEHAFGKLIENKRIELDRWRLAVTDYELRHYLPVL